jgi:hypothetical protein
MPTEQNGNAETTPNTNATGERTEAERIEALVSKNGELLGKLKDSKTSATAFEEKFNAVLEHLGIDATLDDPMSVIAEQKKADAQKKLDSMSKSEKQEHEIANLKDTVNDLLEQKKHETEKALKFELDNSVNSALTNEGVNAKGLAILGTFIKTGITHDENGYHAIKDGVRLSVADYAKSIVGGYPEFVGASTVAGSGTGTPTRTTADSQRRESVNQNNPRATISSLVREQLNKGQ